MVNFPATFDTDDNLHAVQDNVDNVEAEHHNVLKDAIIAIEEKLGIDDSADTDSIDFILKQITPRSDPPSGYYKVYNLYAIKIGTKFHLVMEQDTNPIP